MTRSPFSVLIGGVGGQGTILASRLLSGIALRQDCVVKVSEIHGMSQRGGSVVSQVRFGDDVASPIISQGQADIILAFEKLEALRSLSYLKPNGRILYNTQAINPMPVIMGNLAYPPNTEAHIQAACPSAIAIDALALAEAAGTVKAVNVVLLGLLSRFLAFDESVWLDTLREVVPSRFYEVNIRAFQAGRAFFQAPGQNSGT